MELQGKLVLLEFNFVVEELLDLLQRLLHLELKPEETRHYFLGSRRGKVDLTHVHDERISIVLYLGRLVKVQAIVDGCPHAEIEYEVIWVCFKVRPN